MTDLSFPGRVHRNLSTAAPYDAGRRSMLREGFELANAVDFTIPHCVSDVEQTVALIRASREEWLRAQAAGKSAARAPLETTREPA